METGMPANPETVDTGSSPEAASSQPQGTQKDSGDLRAGVKSLLLTPEQHRTVLLLDATFPKWSEKHAHEMSSPDDWTKWRAIVAEMHARFPDLHQTVTLATLQGICNRVRSKERKLQHVTTDESKSKRKRKNKKTPKPNGWKAKDSSASAVSLLEATASSLNQGILQCRTLKAAQRELGQRDKRIRDLERALATAKDKDAAMAQEKELVQEQKREAVHKELEAQRKVSFLEQDVDALTRRVDAGVHGLQTARSASEQRGKKSQDLEHALASATGKETTSSQQKEVALEQRSEAISDLLQAQCKLNFLEQDVEALVWQVGAGVHNLEAEREVEQARAEMTQIRATLTQRMEALERQNTVLMQSVESVKEKSKTDKPVKAKD